MSEKGIHITEHPRLNRPILIAGFDGWGNALDISIGMVDYLIRRFGAEYFGGLDPDLELGFGYGFSADEFQAAGVSVHYIVEPHPTMLAFAQAWAIGKRGVVILEGFARDVPVPDVEFDLLFDDRNIDALDDTFGSYRGIPTDCFDPTRFRWKYVWTRGGMEPKARLTKRGGN